MLTSFSTQTITRQRPQLVDDGHGNTLPDWDLPTSDAVITGCSVQPGATAEDRLNRNGVLISWTVFAPAGIDVRSDLFDRIVYNGMNYDVDGEPERWSTGILDHTKLFLRTWEG